MSNNVLKLSLIALVIFFLVYSAPSLPAVSLQEEAFEITGNILALGPRPSGSEALEKLREYMKSYFAGEGLELKQDVFSASTPIGAVEMKNLIVKIPGTHGGKTVILAAHYESKYFDDLHFVGANDNASGTALLMAMAAGIRDKKYSFDVDLVFFDGEESFGDQWTDTDSLYGSRHYVDTLKRTGAVPSVRAMILLDMIGDKDLGIDIDSSSTLELSKLLVKSAESAGHVKVLSGRSISIEDDHTPFLKAGIPAIDIIDFSYDSWHTQDDTIEMISPESLGKVGDIVMKMLDFLEEENSN